MVAGTFVTSHIAGLRPRLTPGSTPSSHIPLHSNTRAHPFPKKFNTEVSKIFSTVDIGAYPSQDYQLLEEGLAHLYGVHKENILIDNGSSSILHLLFEAVLNAGDTVASVVPTFVLYPHLCKRFRAMFIEIEYGSDFSFPFEELLVTNADMYVIANPNNPTGTFLALEQIENFLDKTDKLVVVDEAYIEFASGESATSLLSKYTNLFVVRTLSKAYGLAGARIGVGIGDPLFVEQLKKIQAPFHLDMRKQPLILQVCKYQKELLAYIPKLQETREWFAEEVQKLGYTTAPSKANFILLTGHKDGIDFADVYDFLFEHTIATMYYPHVVYKHEYLRITIGTQEQMENVIKLLKEYG